MALDNFTDAPLAALLALLKDALNNELAVDMDRAVETTHAWPIDFARMSAQQLPALIAYRTRGGFRERMTGPHDERVTLRLAYQLPPTPGARLEMRWALLHKAWEVAIATFLAGHHVAHAADAEVLTAAGFIDIDLGAAQVDYLMPAVDAEVAPRWEATVTVTLRQTTDISGLADLSLSSELHPEDLPADERPLVAEILD